MREAREEKELRDVTRRWPPAARFPALVLLRQRRRRRNMRAHSSAAIAISSAAPIACADRHTLRLHAVPRASLHP